MEKKIIIYLLLIFFIIIAVTIPNPKLVLYTKPEINKLIPNKYYLKQSSVKDPFFPSVIKPVFGCKGKGVKFIKNKKELDIYLKKTNKVCFLQEYYGKNEAGVYYFKDPYFNKIKIITTLKDSSIWPTRCGNNWFKTHIPPCKEFKTSKKLKKAIIDICNKIPDFNVGRFDIRFNTFNELNNGNFKVIELNHKLAGDGLRFQKINPIKWMEHLFGKLEVW